jgi:hypothetical protein
LSRIGLAVIKISAVVLVIAAGLTASCSTSANEHLDVSSIPLISPTATQIQAAQELPGVALFHSPLPQSTIFTRTPSQPDVVDPVPVDTGGPPFSSPSAPESESVGGELFRAGEFYVAVLRGDYFQMGSQYGKFFKSQMAALYPSVVDDYLIEAHKLSMQDIYNWVNPRYELYPQNLKEFIRGMEAASGIQRQKLIILSQLTDLARITPGGARNAGCSGIAVWGDYTGGGPLVFGRNFDWSGHYAYYNPYITLTVFQPNDGSLPFASVAWAGELLVQTAINNDGLYMESNDGEISGGAEFLSNVIHPSIRAFGWMTGSQDLSQMDTAIQESNTARAMSISVADKTGAHVYECTPKKTVLRSPDQDGLLVVTNHFVEPAWTNLLQPKDQGLTETRHRNLLALAEKYKGSFDEKVMQQVLDTSIQNGGATKNPDTVYQVIAIPEQLRIWIKAQGYADWTEIDLKPLFRY